jgi:propanol-preferring alcohol dehydrogenase
MFAANGFIHIIGIDGETLQTGIFYTPFGASVRAPYWGTGSELVEVLNLARSRALTVHVEQFAIEDAVEAYHKLHEGTVSGRAVVSF